jgi:hypothetical protein
MFPGFPGVGLLDGGHATGSARLICSSYSMGVSMPSDECLRRRLWKISRYSNRALASSIRVRHRCRLSSSVCTRPQKDSITALSQQSPIDPIEGTSPEARARSVKAQEVNCASSTGRCNTGPGGAVADGHVQGAGDQRRGLRTADGPAGAACPGRTRHRTRPRGGSLRCGQRSPKGFDPARASADRLAFGGMAQVGGVQQRW